MNGLLVQQGPQASYRIESVSAGDDESAIHVVVQNSAGAATSGAAILNVADTVPPVVTIDVPVASTAQPTYRVTGAATDLGSGVASLVVTNTTTGISVTPTVASDGYYEADIGIALGDNIIEAVALDGAGNSGSASATITGLTPSLPVITIVSPPTGSSTELASIAVTGTVRTSLDPNEVRLELGNLLTFRRGAAATTSLSSNQFHSALVKTRWWLRRQRAPA